MKGILLSAICCLLSMLLITEVTEARPKERLDQRTKMCRFLDRGTLDWESEPWGIGGKKFKEVCQSCHAKDNAEGIPFLHAESYTAESWNKIFYKRRKQCARNGAWSTLSEEELLMVNDYLYRNGAWTYDPYDADSCG